MFPEENEPQIKAPRVTPLEGVSTYALRGIRVRGVENPQGFGIDERGFVASNPVHLIGSWDLALFLFMSLSFYNSFSKTVALNLRLSAFICG